MWAAFFSGGNAGIVSAVSTILYAVFYFTAVKAHWGKKLFTLLMMSNLANFIVMASKCIEGQIFPELALQSYRWSFSLIMGLLQILLLIPLVFYIKRVFTPAVGKEPSGMEWCYLWLIPATFYLIWFYGIYGNATKSSLELALRPGNAIFFFFVNLGAFLIYFVVSRLILEQNKNLTLLQKNHQLSMQSLQYENLQEKITDARRAKHDLRHHIAIMQEFLKNGEYDELKDYLSRYQRSLPDDSLITFCENPIANAVLLYYAQQAKNNRIDYIVKTEIPEQNGIEDTDISVLFGNLLENALDACMTEKEESRKIMIRAKTDASSLFLTVDNSFSGEIPQSNDGISLSTKHSGTGLGTESVKSIAEKYNGIYRSEQKNGLFLSSVMLCIKQK